MAYEEIFLVVGIASTLIAVSIPFIMRGMNKGEKQIITTNNFYNLNSKVTDLFDKTEKGLLEAKDSRARIIEQHRQDMHKVYDTLSAITSDLRVHTNQIASFCIDVAKIEERLRDAENSIIRNEKQSVARRRKAFFKPSTVNK